MQDSQQVIDNDFNQIHHVGLLLPGRAIWQADQFSDLQEGYSCLVKWLPGLPMPHIP